MDPTPFSEQKDHPGQMGMAPKLESRRVGGHGTLKNMIEGLQPRPADGGKGVKEGREDCNFRNWLCFFFFSWTVLLVAMS